MVAGLGMYVVLAALSPILAAMVPLGIAKCNKELPKWMPLALLGLSSGMLFAVSTLDLIPEGIEMATLQAKKEWNENFVVEYSDEEYEHDHSPVSGFDGMDIFDMLCGDVDWDCW